MNKEQFRKELEDAIHAYLNWCHTSSVLLSEDTVTQWLISESGKAITTRLAALDDGDDYVEGLKELLRFDHCPEILIENPGLIKGQPATPESIAWANECIARYEANKEKEDKSQEEMWDKFRADIYYGGFINNLADSKEVTELINYWKTKYFISSQPKLLDDGQEGKGLEYVGKVGLFNLYKGTGLPSAGGAKDAVGFINWAMDNNYQCKIKNIIGGYEWYINDEDGVPIDYLTPEQLYKKYLSKGQPE